MRSGSHRGRKRSGVKHAWAGAWVNTLFRSEGAGLASELINQAVAATRAVWGDAPAPHGIVTFVDRDAVKPKRDPGYCYLKAGWQRIGETKVRGLMAFGQSPDAMPPAVPPFGYQSGLAV